MAALAKRPATVPASLPRLSAEARSLVAFVRTMGSFDSPPAELTPARLNSLASEVDRVFAPADGKTVAIALDKLFAVVPMPGPEALQIWIGMFVGYPVPVLFDAVDRLIRLHRWPSPPSIADLDSLCRESAPLDDYLKSATAVHKGRSLLQNSRDRAAEAHDVIAPDFLPRVIQATRDRDADEERRRRIARSPSKHGDQ